MSEPRVSPQLYSAARAWLLEHDPDGAEMLSWSERGRRQPETAEALAGEIIWIILCAGRSAQAARTIERKVWAALTEGRPVAEAFGYRKKAAAIERAWTERKADFEGLNRILAFDDTSRLIDWCGALPFVGDDTKFQLAKNVGAQVCKPDIWMCRLAGIPDRPRRPWRERFAKCMELCSSLSEATGDSVPVIDSMLWLACNKGVVRVSAEAGPVAFVPGPVTARPILCSWQEPGTPA